MRRRTAALAVAGLTAAGLAGATLGPVVSDAAPQQATPQVTQAPRAVDVWRADWLLARQHGCDALRPPAHPAGYLVKVSASYYQQFMTTAQIQASARLRVLAVVGAPCSR
jgi:hypothetical protein